MLLTFETFVVVVVASAAVYFGVSGVVWLVEFAINSTKSFPKVYRANQLCLSHLSTSMTERSRIL